MTGTPSDPEPDATADIESFSDISQVSADVPGIGAVSITGRGSPGRLARLVFTPLFSLTGFASGTTLLVADQPGWAVILFVLAQLAAVVCWVLASRATEPP